jgi:hypothetical protein
MGRLLNLFKASVPPQRAPQRRAVGDLVDIHIVGEASYVPAIDGVLRRYGRGEFEIVLHAEPQNRYDRSAVAVTVDGHLVGYLGRDMAEQWQAMVLAAESEGFTITGTAKLLGGTEDKPNLGVFGAARWAGAGRPVDRWGRV